MLLVKTKLDRSKIHGTGLFADEDIPKGTEIWRFHPKTCNVYSLHDFGILCSNLPLSEICLLMNYSYIKNNKIFHITDNTRFINHSESPCVGLVSEQSEVALRDICKGEELLENYYHSYDSTDFFNHTSIFSARGRNEVLSFLEELYVKGQDIHRAL